MCAFLFHVKHIRKNVNQLNKEYMKIAVEESNQAALEGEIPVGAVIVKDNIIIAKSHNMKEQLKCCTKHAEILAIESANSLLNDWRLNDCEMYVTMEPCIMCCGALIQSRISKIYYLVDNNKFGGVGNCTLLLNNNLYNHQLNVYKMDDAELENQIKRNLKKFFLEKR